MANRPVAARRVKSIIGHLARTALLLLLLEIGARGYYVWKHHLEPVYLLKPFKGSRVFLYKRQGVYTEFSPCSGRMITCHVNKYGGRGDDWTLAKPPGVIRIIAEGGSSTFGSTNPDWATWPVLLEQALRQRGMSAEVLNLGVPGKRVEQIDAEGESLARFRPDYVIFYEGINNATSHKDPHMHANVTLARFHATPWLGGLTSWLYYRSLLYTKLLEKMQMRMAAQQDWVVPEIGYFRTHLVHFVQTLRAHDVTPVFVLQVTKAAPDPAFRDFALDDARAIKAAILQKAQARANVVDDPDYDPSLTALWTYQTQTMVEVVRRIGELERIPVIDPRAQFAQIGEARKLFCDIIHLTDDGNRLLATAIADAWDSTVPRKTPKDGDEAGGRARHQRGADRARSQPVVVAVDEECGHCSGNH